MLRDILQRGNKISVPDSSRIIKSGYYDPLKIEEPRKSISLGPEQSLRYQLNRGNLIPNPSPRIIDHDRTQRLNIQDHGVKVQLAEKTLTAQSNPITQSIKDATVVNTTALANAIGMTINDDINETKKQLIDYFTRLENNSFVPSAQIQQQILTVLQQILASAPVSTPIKGEFKMKEEPLKPVTDIDKNYIFTSQSNGNKSILYLKTDVWKVLATHLGIDEKRTKKRIDMISLLFNDYMGNVQFQDVLSNINDKKLTKKSNVTDMVDVIRESQKRELG